MATLGVGCLPPPGTFCLQGTVSLLESPARHTGSVLPECEDLDNRPAASVRGPEAAAWERTAFWERRLMFSSFGKSCRPCCGDQDAGGDSAALGSFLVPPVQGEEGALRAVRGGPFLLGLK